MRYMDIKNTNAAIRETKKKTITKKFIVAVVLAFGVCVFLVTNSKNLFNPISIIANASATSLKEADGRTNILLLGLDKRNGGTVTSILTDTMIVASVGRVDGDIVLISAPRDLWVQSPKGNYSKINALYAWGGVPDIRAVTETVLGIPIHYYAVVDFSMFEQVVDTLGGINVSIDRSFDDYKYPIEGKENAPENERYETLHFVAGPTNMDGITALKFVRSRHGNNEEGTDFARSKRQQKVIVAIKDKVLSVETLFNLTKLQELYNIYSKNVETNIDFQAIQGFYGLSKQVNFSNIRSIVMDNGEAQSDGGLLYAPTDTSLYGGAYVLIPKSGDYSQIHAFVQKYLFSK